jgi:ABC-type multidrug transport system permease subunit
METPIIRSKIWPSLIVAIVLSFGTIFFGSIAISGLLAHNWVILIIEIIITYCCASSGVSYWRKYLVHRSRVKQRKDLK